ncbi:MAG: sulfotransferase family protein [Streptosporangiaceae bacterium]
MTVQSLALPVAKAVANTTMRRWGVLTARWRPVPDFLIVGTKRGGTTSLFDYLTRLPGILRMFPQMRKLKSPAYFFQRYSLGEAWYRSHFHTEAYRGALARRLGYRALSGEASPYYLYDPRVPERARQLAPDARIIVLLRDPVKRAWSHYQERVGQGVEPLNFEQALEAEDDRTRGEVDRMLADPSYYGIAHDYYSYRDRGLYLPQLHRWYAQYPPEQILVLRSEDMYADVQATVDRVCAFLGIPETVLPERPRLNYIPTPPMPEGARAELASFFGAHQQALESYLGRAMHWPFGLPVSAASTSRE